MKQVKFLSIFVIIGSIYSIFSSFQNILGPEPLFVIPSYFYIGIISPLSIVAAIFIFNKKEWARRVIVIVSLVVAMESIITMSSRLDSIQEQVRYELSANPEVEGRMREEIRAQYARMSNGATLSEEQIKAALGQSTTAMESVAKSIAMAFMIIGLLFNAYIFYFFTKDRTKRFFQSV